MASITAQTQTQSPTTIPTTLTGPPLPASSSTSQQQSTTTSLPPPPQQPTTATATATTMTNGLTRLTGLSAVPPGQDNVQVSSSVPFNATMKSVETKVAALTLDNNTSAPSPSVPFQQQPQQPTATTAVRPFFASSLPTFSSGMRYDLGQTTDKRHSHHHRKQQQHHQQEYFVKQAFGGGTNSGSNGSNGGGNGGNSGAMYSGSALMSSGGGGGGGTAASVAAGNNNNNNNGGGGSNSSSSGSTSNVEDGIAPFVIKTYELVNDPNTQNLVSWSQEHDKQAFVVCTYIYIYYYYYF